MSRIGKQPITIPEEVSVEVNDRTVTVKGNKGELAYEIRPGASVVQRDGKLEVKMSGSSKSASAYWGLTRALISNMILGVSEGFEKKLELVGVGYRVRSGVNGISLTLGYSHPVEFKKPDGVEIEVEDNKNITIRGIDKQLVGQTAAKIRELRKPEPYKGKGIRYAGEEVKTKPGKAGKI